MRNDDSAPPAESPPRISLVITELDRGGAEQTLVRLASGLHSRGWDVDVVSLRDAGPLSDSLRNDRIPIAALHCRSLADLRCLWRLRRHWRRLKPDIVLSFLHQANLYSRLAAGSVGVPVVVSGIRVADRRRIVTVPERFTRGLVDRYIACSPSVAAVHSQTCGIAGEQISVIFNGVDATGLRETPAAARSELGVSDDDILVAFAGRLSTQKGLSDLLQALAPSPEPAENGWHRDEGRTSKSGWHRGQGGWHLVVAGDGPQRKKLEHQAAAAGLPVRFLGSVPEVASLFRAADVVVIPSWWEGTPNVMLEAMACGTPVLAAAVDGMRDIADRYPGVALYESRNIQALQQQLRRFRDDPEPFRESARTLQLMVSEQLTWDRMVDEYHELLTILVTQTASQRT